MAPRRNSRTVEKNTGITRDANDADESRTVDHADADKVRNGELSAAQLGDHADSNDVITPAGYIETAAMARSFRQVETAATARAEGNK